MGSAYTPGLAVTGQTRIRKTRRLPLKGEVLVRPGDRVMPETVVARTELPGDVTLVRVADKLGVPGEELPQLLRCAVGETVAVGDVLAETPGLFGKFFRSQVTAPVAGTIETVTARTGNVSIRQAPRPVALNAYLHGTVAEVLPAEGAVIEATGAFIQGIFGIGGERAGRLQAWAQPDAAGVAAGAVVAIPGRISAAFYRACAAAGAVAVVGASILDEDLRAILGHDIGVAITGEEDVPASLIVTEGFGDLAMTVRTWRLLQSLDGRACSVSGATQIRAGVIRPELIVPDLEAAAVELAEAVVAQELAVGTPVRLIREPYFGRLGTVTALPAEPTAIATGARVRVLTARLDDGSEVTVPRANVELAPA